MVRKRGRCDFMVGPTLVRVQLLDLGPPSRGKDRMFKISPQKGSVQMNAKKRRKDTLTCNPFKK